LFLKLIENNDPQLFTVPNLVTALRISGVVGVALWGLHFGNREDVSSFVLSDSRCGLFGALFVALDFLDGFLARRLQQATALGSHFDAQADALGTSFLALTLYAKGRMSRGLAYHMAGAAYLFPLVRQAVPPKVAVRSRHSKEPWARPCAGIMGVCAVLSVVLPGVASTLSHDGNVSESGRYLVMMAGWCAQFAGIVNAGSFFLSYLTLAGISVPGNNLKMS